MSKTKGYDSACEMLAEHFLGQPRKLKDVQELAQHVQDAVEDWFASQEREAADIARAEAAEAQTFAALQDRDDVAVALDTMRNERDEAEASAIKWQGQALRDLGRIDRLEQERDALREALERIAEAKQVWKSERSEGFELLTEIARAALEAKP